MRVTSKEVNRSTAAAFRRTAVEGIYLSLQILSIIVHAFGQSDAQGSCHVRYALVDLILTYMYRVLAQLATGSVYGILRGGEACPVGLVADREHVVGHDRDDRHLLRGQLDELHAQLDGLGIVEVDLAGCLDDLVELGILPAHPVAADSTLAGRLVVATNARTRGRRTGRGGRPRSRSSSRTRHRYRPAAVILARVALSRTSRRRRRRRIPSSTARSCPRRGSSPGGFRLRQIRAILNGGCHPAAATCRRCLVFMPLAASAARPS